jgi:hypothetical protein
MSKEGTNVLGVVIVTVCVTSVGLAAGWFGVSHYLGQQTVRAEDDEAAAEPAPARKTTRVRKNNSRSQDRDASTELASAGDVATADESSDAARDDELSTKESGPSTADEAASESPAATPVPVSAEIAEPVEDARTIMEEAERRADAKFYRYDGLLQTFDAKNKMTEKSWTFDRVGSNG